MAFLAGVPHLGSDGLTYIQMGDAILDGKPVSFFPNGFPILLAAFAHLMGDADPQPAWLAVIVLMSTGIVAFVHLIARRWLEPAFALAAMAVIAVWPTQLYYTAQFLSDVPSTFFLAFGVHLALRQQPVSAGFVLGIATLVRDSLLPSVVLLVAIGMVDPERRRDMARLLLAVAIVQAFEWVLQARGVTAPPSTASLNLLLAVTSMSTDGIPRRAAGPVARADGASLGDLFLVCPGASGDVHPPAAGVALRTLGAVAQRGRSGRPARRACPPGHRAAVPAAASWRWPASG